MISSSMDKNLTNISDVNGNHNSGLSPYYLELKEIKRPNLYKRLIASRKRIVGKYDEYTKI